MVHRTVKGSDETCLKNVYLQCFCNPGSHMSAKARSDLLTLTSCHVVDPHLFLLLLTLTWPCCCWPQSGRQPLQGDSLTCPVVVDPRTPAASRCRASAWLVVLLLLTPEWPPAAAGRQPDAAGRHDGWTHRRLPWPPQLLHHQGEHVSARGESLTHSLLGVHKVISLNSPQSHKSE